MTRTVILFGDSITRGQVSASYIGPLRRKLKSTDYQFINHGINNDTTYNLLRRIHYAEFLSPDAVLILIGTNDMIAARSDASAALYMINRGIPQRPTVEWSAANVRQILRRLKRRTRARIGLLSIPMLGEDLTSQDNENVRSYNRLLAETAAAERVAFLPLYDRLAAVLEGHPPGRPFQPSAPLTIEFLARRLLYKEDFYTFSRRKGYRLFIDGVHFNPRGAEIVASEIVSFLQTPTPTRPGA